MSDVGPDPADAGTGDRAVVVDSLGRLCPLPVVDLAREAAQHPPGTVLVLLSDDPAAANDVPAWCAMRGHTYVGAEPVEPPGDAPGDVPDRRAPTRHTVRLGPA